MSTKGDGKAYQYILEHLTHQGDDCVPWPFCRDKHGRGELSVNGERWWAHRLMCTLAHGEPPSPAHKATHNCGKGHEGCIAPRHLEWKTQKENIADCRLHGTQARHTYGRYGKLGFGKAEQIRAMRETHTQGQLAALFEVSEGAINDIWRGRTWARPHRGGAAWSAEEDARLRSAIDQRMTFREAAATLGKPKGSIVARVRRLGLHSKTGHHACKYF